MHSANVVYNLLHRQSSPALDIGLARNTSHQDNIIPSFPMKSRSNSTGRSPHSQSISFLVLCLCVLSTLGARASSIPQWDGLRALETEYRVVDLPGEFQGLPAVAIPRGDSKNPGAAYSFEIDAPATVFIGVQRRGQSAPPAGWEPAKNIKLEWSTNYFVCPFEACRPRESLCRKPRPQARKNRSHPPHRARHRRCLRRRSARGPDLR